MLTSAESTNSKMPLLTRQNNISICLLNDYYVGQPALRRQRWLHLARLVAARASGRGTGQQMLSTYYSYTPSSHQASTTSPPTFLVTRQFIFNKQNYDRSTYPSFQSSLRNRHESLTYVAYLYHPSDTISQITTARPCGLQH